ncbi:MAG: hypothetical protein M1826_004687 [Phylliscum demangeonii]|nr:MAG: hypothetical protein M1826_004687 [Phylliscum demangeonii]
MCRFAQLYFPACRHTSRFDLSGWCSTNRRNSRYEGDNCHQVHRLVFQSRCEACAVREGRRHVEAIRNSLYDLHNATLRDGPPSALQRAVKRRREKVVALAHEYACFVAQHNNQLPRAFNRRFAHYKGHSDDEDPDVDEVPIPPRLPQLRYHDPALWLKLYRERFATRLLMSPEPGSETGWRNSITYNADFYALVADELIAPDESEYDLGGDDGWSDSEDEPDSRPESSRSRHASSEDEFWARLPRDVEDRPLPDPSSTEAAASGEGDGSDGHDGAAAQAAPSTALRASTGAVEENDAYDGDTEADDHVHDRHAVLITEHQAVAADHGDGDVGVSITTEQHHHHDAARANLQQRGHTTDFLARDRPQFRYKAVLTALLELQGGDQAASPREVPVFFIALLLARGAAVAST